MLKHMQIISRLLTDLAHLVFEEGLPTTRRFMKFTALEVTFWSKPCFLKPGSSAKKTTKKKSSHFFTNIMKSLLVRKVIYESIDETH